MLQLNILLGPDKFDYKVLGVFSGFYNRNPH